MDNTIKRLSAVCDSFTPGKKRKRRVQDSVDFSKVSPDKLKEAKAWLEANKDEDYEIYDKIDEVNAILFGENTAPSVKWDYMEPADEGRRWPNFDSYSSSIIKVNDPCAAITSLWESSDPMDLERTPLPVAKLLGLSYEELTPGFYYVNGADEEVYRLGSTEEELLQNISEWPEGSDDDDYSDDYYDDEHIEDSKEPKKAKKRGKKTSNKKRSKVKDAAYVAEFTKVRESVGDKTIVDELEQYLSTDELKEFAQHMISSFDLD